VLGWDASGIVVSVGDEVASFAIGDHVYFAGDITRAGANSEYALVDARIAGPKPKTLDFAEAAAMPLTTLTAYEALFARMKIARTEGSRRRSLLVIGGAGGVGSIAIQLAKVLTDVTVIATASRDETRAWVKEMGADRVVDRGALRAQLAALGYEQIDFILCTADTDPYFAALVDLVAPQGSLCFIVPPTMPVDLAPLHAKSAAVAWELMYTRSMFQTSDLAEQGRILAEVGSANDARHIRSTLTQRLSPLCAATMREAHARIESGKTIGKIAIEGW
jgi:zinc-binding alcohol dehydrogenase family protein